MTRAAGQKPLHHDARWSPDAEEHGAQAEADLAAALFVELCEFMRGAAEKQGKRLPAPSVGVVTPYRQQKAALRDAFRRAVGPEAAARVRGISPCRSCHATAVCMLHLIPPSPCVPSVLTVLCPRAIEG